MKSPRSILYIRADSFFYQIESLRKPEVKDRPVIVLRERGKAAGIVVCASAEARVCGIEDGMGARRAQSKCPDGVIVRADYAFYRDVFERMLEILSQYTPLLEPNTLGTAYMDVSGSRNLFGDSKTISFRIISEISRNLGLNVHIGCGSNKLIAMIAHCIGEEVLLVPPGGEWEFLKNLPVSMLLCACSHVVKVVNLEKRLFELGIRKIGQLAGVSQSLLVRQFGKDGAILYRLAKGIDEFGVESKYPRDTIIIEHTYDKEVSEPSEVEAVLDDMASEAYTLLTSRNTLAGEVLLRLYWNLETVSGYFKFKSSTDSRESILYALVKQLREIMKPGMQVYKIEVRLLDMEKGRPAQLCLFGTGDQEFRVARTVEMVRGRFGEKSISTASSINHM